MGEFSNRYGPWAVVTGATSGTGYMFASLLAEKGIHLVLVARGEQTLLETKIEIEELYKVQVKTIAADLSNPQSISDIADITKSLEIGLLINNAGYSITGEFHSDSWENQRDLLETNLTSPMALTHMFVKDMVERRRGGIILVSSTVAYTPTPLWSVYSSGKAGLLNFGESISQELKKHNVDVLTVCPGAMNTRFQERSKVQTPNSMNPRKVVELTLKSLGSRTTIIPGITNRLLFYVIGRLLPNFIRLPLVEKQIKKTP